MRVDSLRFILVGCAAIGAYGCSKKADKTPSAAASAAVASAAPSASAPQKPRGIPIATGPSLAILPGEGVGPIRFGATVETIERLMAAPCELREENQCRYIGRAVEFFLTDGVVSEMRLHRLHRKTHPEPRVFGVFNGRFVEGAAFGMYREAVSELLGPPKKVDPVSAPNPRATVEVHHYDNMRLEYDRLDNGNIVLGGVVLLRPPGSAAGASSEKGTPKR